MLKISVYQRDASREETRRRFVEGTVADRKAQNVAQQGKHPSTRRGNRGTQKFSEQINDPISRDHTGFGINFQVRRLQNVTGIVCSWFIATYLGVPCRFIDTGLDETGRGENLMQVRVPNWYLICKETIFKIVLLLEK
jgi:hypothetical protein